MIKGEVIRSLDIFTLIGHEHTIMSDARHDLRGRVAMWVRLRTDHGEGWAEAALWGGTPETVATILTAELFPLVAGEDASKIHYLWDKLYQHTLYHGRRGAVIAAMSAIDVALWDLFARSCRQPLVNVLGRHSDAVLPYASAGFYAPGKSASDLASEFRRLRSEGFTAFKMKVGRQIRKWGNVWERPYAVTLEQDAERVFSVREAIGNNALLLIDANTEWDVKTSLRFLDMISDANVFFLEEPVGPDHYREAAELRARTATRIAGFETEYTRFAYRDLLASAALDVVQPDPCWCGGLSEARRIAAMASAWGVLCVPHSISSVVSFLVSAHLVGSLDNGFLVEWDATGSPWMDNFLSSGKLNPDGTMDIGGTPGWGDAPDLERVAEFGECSVTSLVANQSGSLSIPVTREL